MKHLRPKRISSLQKRIMGTSLLIVLPFLALFLLYNYYFLRATSEDLARSGRQSAVLYAQRLDKDLEAIGTQLFNLTYSNTDFRELGAAADELAAHVSAHNLAMQYRAMINAYQSAGAFFVCNARTGTYRDVFAEGYDYADTQALRAYIRDVTLDNTIRSMADWFPEQINGRWYLLRILGQNGTYVASMVDFSRILRGEPPPADAHALFTAGTQVLYGDDFLTASNIELRAGSDSYLAGSRKQYLVVSDALAHGGTELVFIFAQPGYLGRLQGIQQVLLLSSLAALVCLPVAYHLMKRWIFNPMKRLVGRIGPDEKPAAQDAFEILEFGQVDSALTGMRSQIDELRVLAYEREIEKQKAELQYLQLQIRPHFFLNCLKSLYGMAQQGRYQQIQEMVLAISTHLRYTFRDNLQLVPLSEELDYVENYIRIQQMGMRLAPEYSCTAPGELGDIRVPPLSIQTFVENSVKYGSRGGVRLSVRVKAVPLATEDGDFLDITIQDNGNGFPEDVLAELDQDKLAGLYGEHHVGVRNVANRLKLLYGERATMVFFNAEEGAVSEIILPIDDKNSQEKEAAV